MEKRKIRINAMDFVIVAVILAAAALLLYVFLWSDESETTQKKTAEITYVVEIVGVDEQFQHNIQDGQRVEDAVKRGYIGTVKGTPEVRDMLKAEYRSFRQHKLLTFRIYSYILTTKKKKGGIL